VPATSPAIQFCSVFSVPSPNFPPVSLFLSPPLFFLSFSLFIVRGRPQKTSILVCIRAVFLPLSALLPFFPHSFPFLQAHVISPFFRVPFFCVCVVSFVIFPRNSPLNSKLHIMMVPFFSHRSPPFLPLAHPLPLGPVSVCPFSIESHPLPSFPDSTPASFIRGTTSIFPLPYPTTHLINSVILILTPPPHPPPNPPPPPPPPPPTHPPPCRYPGLRTMADGYKCASFLPGPPYTPPLFCPPYLTRFLGVPPASLSHGHYGHTTMPLLVTVRPRLFFFFFPSLSF